MSNNCSNALSLAVLSLTGNLSISLQNKARRNVASPRALWFDFTGEFPRGKLLRDIIQQDRKMQWGQQMCSWDFCWKVSVWQSSWSLHSSHNPLVAHSSPGQSLSIFSRISHSRTWEIGIVCFTVSQVDLIKGLALRACSVCGSKPLIFRGTSHQ